MRGEAELLRTPGDGAIGGIIVTCQTALRAVNAEHARCDETDLVSYRLAVLHIEWALDQLWKIHDQEVRS
ncbi:MAG: hypothetical protein ACKVWR_21815 [Acidimicrobiales bacterium]